jgi:hypothetical protein
MNPQIPDYVLTPKTAIILFALFLVLSSSAQKNPATPEFKNQGEQENYQAKQLFEKEYVPQHFDKFTGLIHCDINDCLFNHIRLTLAITLPELQTIFSSGLFYPDLIPGRICPGDSLIISSLEELPFAENGSAVKRFRFWLFENCLANPTVYFIELTNDQAKKGEEISSFVKGARLTFVRKGWIII